MSNNNTTTTTMETLRSPKAGYQLYHHAFLLTEDGMWTVVQQGMSLQDRTARRYHWLSETAQNLIVEPHSAIVCDMKHEKVLDMTAKESETCRKTSVDLAKEQPEKIMRLIIPNKLVDQKSLQEWLPKSTNNSGIERLIEALSMPRNINWKALREVYEFQPRNYEELLAFRGVGPATVRGLALVAELVYVTSQAGRTLSNTPSPTVGRMVCPIQLIASQWMSPFRCLDRRFRRRK